VSNPALLRPGKSSSIGLGLVEDAPDVSDLVAKATTELGKLGPKLLPPSVLDDSMNNLQRMYDLTSAESIKSLMDSALDGGIPLLLHNPGVVGKDTYQVTLRAKVTDVGFKDVVNDGLDIEHVVTGSTRNQDSQGQGTSWDVLARLPAAGVVSQGNNPHLTGTGGVMGNVTVGHSHSITTSQSSSDETGRVRRASGPAVRYNANVEFELVVEKSGKTLPTITPMSRPVVLRTLADNEKLAIDGNPASATDRDSAASNLDAKQGQPGNALAWQLMGHGALPPSASVEAFHGAGDVRDAAVRALTNAGANTGITGAGTGAKCMPGSSTRNWPGSATASRWKCRNRRRVPPRQNSGTTRPETPRSALAPAA
jgi:hypothetical protein